MSMLADMRKLKGPIKLEPSAEDFFNHWYESIPEPTKGDEHMAGYISRKPMTVKKLAMVLMISESHKLVMKQHHLELAIKVMNALEEQLMSEVGGMEASEASRATDIVATIIARKPDGMSRREVMQKAYKRIKGRREEFDRIIDWLLHLGTITQGRHPDTNEMWYKAVNG